MKLGPIALKLRLADISAFGNRIAGAANLASALAATLLGETAFVIPLVEAASDNNLDTGINQNVTERFGVVVALNNDVSQADKLGLGAYDRLHDIRAEIWKAILGWIPSGTEDLIYYSGGRLLGLTRAYLWWQFEFVMESRIDDDDGVEMGDLPNFDTIYAQWEMIPSANIPIHESIPVSGFTPDAVNQVDLTQNPDDGGFDRGFSSGFDVYTGAY